MLFVPEPVSSFQDPFQVFSPYWIHGVDLPRKSFVVGSCFQIFCNWNSGQISSKIVIKGDHVYLSCFLYCLDTFFWCLYSEMKSFRHWSKVVEPDFHLVFSFSVIPAVRNVIAST